VQVGRARERLERRRVDALYEGRVVGPERRAALQVHLAGAAQHDHVRDEDVARRRLEPLSRPHAEAARARDHPAPVPTILGGPRGVEQAHAKRARRYSPIFSIACWPSGRIGAKAWKTCIMSSHSSISTSTPALRARSAMRSASSSSVSAVPTWM